MRITNQLRLTNQIRITNANANNESMRIANANHESKPRNANNEVR